MTIIAEKHANQKVVSIHSGRQSRTMQRLMPLMRYVEARQHSGPDLYDSLNSKLFKATPFYHNRFLRLCLIQFGKMSPINLRPLLLTPPGFNPKGGGLFLLGYLNMLNSEESSSLQRQQAEQQAHAMMQRLAETLLPQEHGCAWGYHHDWQARAFNVPNGVPNLVSSVYVGRSLLAYHHQFGSPEALKLALGVGKWLRHEMIKFENERHLCFNYIPGRDAEVHNASLHGASYLSQLLAFLPKEQAEDYREKITKAVQFSITDINPDGSWPYGTKPFHRWVDNFHTAYNIECLVRIGQNLNTDAFTPVLARVTDYYLTHLFEADGTPRYRSTTTYPIDVHTISQTFLTLNLLDAIEYPGNQERRRQLAERLEGIMDEFQDPQGFYYYQKTRIKDRWTVWNKIPYIRWGQAWMFFALSTGLSGSKTYGLTD